MLASLSVRQWEALIRPKSIAVIGASSRPGPQNFAQRILNNNDRVGYRGDIFLVNPRHTSILERPCHPSVDALPAVPD
ncbi:MAG: CoA-binding protein, partial [Rhodobacteraceae bacterium]|nr:CoA-binding protein [Paracoccaceae bacterium]